MNEFGLIETYFRPLAKYPGAFSLRDDAAALDVPAGKQLIVTKDAIAQGVHFTGAEEPALIAKKLLRANLSDLAAKGALPLGYLLMVALPAGHFPDAYLASFAQGLREDQEQFGLSLLGGDTIATHGPPVFSLTALGLVDTGKALLRSGAKLGDRIFVSGTIGDAFLGLKEARNTRHEARDAFLLDRYLLPQPRLELGQSLAGIASACMDISDGLAQDLSHLCAASGVGAQIHVERVPLSDAARASVQKNSELLSHLISGGDDYELLFTVPETRITALQAIGKDITEIGVVTAEKTVSLLLNGKPFALQHKGYSHFS